MKTRTSRMQQILRTILMGSVLAAPVVVTTSAIAGPPSRRYPKQREYHRQPQHRTTKHRDIDIHFEFGRRRQVCPPPRPICPPPRPVRVVHVERVERVSYPAHVPAPLYSGFYGLNSRGWDDLRYGHYLRAKHQFLDEIDCEPYAPVLRIGYSVATGRLEHYREAVRSMRRAVSLNPESLLAVREHCDLRDEARCLLDQYMELIRCECPDPDDLFMAAALESILGNWGRADRLICEAQALGDRSASTRDLECFIKDHLRRR